MEIFEFLFVALVWFGELSAPAMYESGKEKARWGKESPPHTLLDCLRFEWLACGLRTVAASRELLQREPSEVKIALNILFCDGSIFCPSRIRRGAPAASDSGRLISKYPAQYPQALSTVVDCVALPQ